MFSEEADKTDKKREFWVLFCFCKSLADSQSSLVLDRACWMRSIGVRGDIHPVASLFCFNLKIVSFFGCFCFDEMDHES